MFVFSTKLHLWSETHLVRVRKTSCCGLRYLLWSPQTRLKTVQRPPRKHPSVWFHKCGWICQKVVLKHWMLTPWTRLKMSTLPVKSIPSMLPQARVKIVSKTLLKTPGFVTTTMAGNAPTSVKNISSCCCNYGWKLSWRFLTIMQWVLNCGHWLSSFPHLQLHHRPFRLQIWTSGHVMWKWYDPFCRNVRMLRGLWHAQMWFSESLATVSLRDLGCKRKER